MTRTHDHVLGLRYTKAGETLQSTELDLSRAEDLIDGNCGIGIKIALVDRVRGARKRFAEAKAKVREIEASGKG
jgi:hypothetical protein